MNRVVLDTNVFLSAFIYGGMSEQIFDLIVDEKLTLFVSPPLVTEIIRKFKEKGASKEMIQNIISLLKLRATLVTPKIKINICRDPADNFLFELAQTSSTDYLITRDNDLLDLKVWKKSRIITPEIFFSILRKKKQI